MLLEKTDEEEREKFLTDSVFLPPSFSLSLSTYTHTAFKQP